MDNSDLLKALSKAVTDGVGKPEKVCMCVFVKRVTNLGPHMTAWQFKADRV